jgi:hypothetical protein
MRHLTGKLSLMTKPHKFVLNIFVHAFGLLNCMSIVTCCASYLDAKIKAKRGRHFLMFGRVGYSFQRVGFSWLQSPLVAHEVKVCFKNLI